MCSLQWNLSSYVARTVDVNLSSDFTCKTWRLPGNWTWLQNLKFRRNLTLCNGGFFSLKRNHYQRHILILTLTIPHRDAIRDLEGPASNSVPRLYKDFTSIFWHEQQDQRGYIFPCCHRYPPMFFQAWVPAWLNNSYNLQYVLPLKSFCAPAAWTSQEK